MSFNIFLKKELHELFRTAKGIVLTIIFVIVAVSSPLLAKLTPEILKWADGATGELAVMGFDIATLPEPTSVDGYVQFVSNFNMMGLLAIIIVFAGTVANEKHKGTAAYILTKNISRSEFILSKFAASCIFTLGGVAISAVVLKIYTDLLFDDKLVSTKYFTLYFAMLSLYIIFVLSISIFSSVVTKNVTGATFVSFLIYIGINILASIPRLGKFMPPKINDLSIMLQSTAIEKITINIVVTILLCVVFVCAGIEIFNRQEL